MMESESNIDEIVSIEDEDDKEFELSHIKLKAIRRLETKLQGSFESQESKQNIETHFILVCTQEWSVGWA